MNELPAEPARSNERDRPGDGQAPAGKPASTVGVGTALAVGCVVALVVLVLLAIVARRFVGAW